MRLRNRLNLILFIIFSIVLIFFAVISYTMEHKQAREEVLQTAQLILEMSVAIRQYTIDEIRPLLQAHSETQFMPQSIPSYAVISTFSLLKKNLKDYVYKETVLNPKNPLNRASEWEVELIRTFRAETDLKILMGNRQTRTNNLMYMAMPFKITDQTCLKCHDTPSIAPPEIIKKYGDNGFGWKLNEIQGARIITVSTSLARKKAQKSVFTLMISIVCIFALILVTINLILQNSVIHPIIGLSGIAEQISMGKKSIADFPQIKIYEFKKLLSSIKRLKISRDHTLDILKQYENSFDNHVQLNTHISLSEPDGSNKETELDE
ncbi:HAMP domain-containing protein [Candidatus Magnetomorum sp. HK-1]|nr:HAMP domain-containing protein [Candidatus Magnetomorum sp. HK-1]